LTETIEAAAMPRVVTNNIARVKIGFDLGDFIRLGQKLGGNPDGFIEYNMLITIKLLCPPL
jgi:hypothetical protein